MLLESKEGLFLMYLSAAIYSEDIHQCAVYRILVLVIASCQG